MKTATTYRPLRMFLFFTVFAVVVMMFNSVGTGGPAVGDDRVCSTSAGDGATSLLVFDPVKQCLELQISDRIVWEAECSMIDAGGKGAESFSQWLSAGGEIGTTVVEGCHLYTGRGQYSNHELAVVAEEINVRPEMLQRVFPGRFAIVFSGGFVLEVFTGIDATSLSRWNNVFFDIMRFADAPFGERCLQITMDATDALTLYNLARPGLLVVIRF